MVGGSHFSLPQARYGDTQAPGSVGEKPILQSKWLGEMLAASEQGHIARMSSAEGHVRPLRGYAMASLQGLSLSDACLFNWKFATAFLVS